MEFKQHRDFMPSLRRLYQMGGMFQKSAEKVNAVIGRISTDQEPLKGLRLTKHGESRINKCIKYDLTGFARLITIDDNGIVLFCFVGAHDDCDSWLDRNRGFTLVENEHGQVGNVQMPSVGSDSSIRIASQSYLTKGELYKALQPETYFDRLVEGLPRSIVRKIEALESINSEENIYNIALQINDPDLSSTIFDVFSLLRKDSPKEALDRIKLYFGETRTAEELTEEEIRRLAESDTIKTLDSNDPLFKRIYEHLVKSLSYMDWMLFLHPDQQKVVDKDFSSPAKLIGVSGSGKTCIVVKRAIRLAEKYQGEKILILTLNRQLSRLIDDMVTAACPGDLRDLIEVRPFFSLCQNLLHSFEPENDRLYSDITWKSMEHIDEIWREFYRCELNNHDAKILWPLHDSLISRSVNAENYIREEFDWIRSALPPDKKSRKEYLSIERRDRGYPLDERFRRILLDGLSFWEKKMKAIGVTDYLGLSMALCKYLDNIQPTCRSIIVDESQDFGTIEYEIIRKLVSNRENDLFFCGDAAQQVSAKHRNFRDAGIKIPSKFSMRIQKNYRNSHEILLAAFDVLEKNLTEAMLDAGDFEILDPEFANFHAAAPLMLKTHDLESEIAFALIYVSQVLEAKADAKACMAICGYSLYEIQKFGERLNISVLDGNTEINVGQMFLSDLEHTKGFEFDAVIIVNCNEGILPDPNKPEQEQYRDLSRFYVAMTRAKDQLVVSHSTRRSPLLDNADENFLVDVWDNYIETRAVSYKGIPPSLEDIRKAEQTDIEEKHEIDMSGPEFLYTKHAIGLNGLLIDKIRRVVPGSKKTSNRVPVAWTTLRQAEKDTDAIAGSRQAFGPEGIIQFRQLIKKLQESTNQSKNKTNNTCNTNPVVANNKQPSVKNIAVTKPIVSDEDVKDMPRKSSKVTKTQSASRRKKPILRLPKNR